MHFFSGSVGGRRGRSKTTILLLMSVVFFMLFAGNAAAQKRFSKSYPAGGESVRLELVNKSGTVTVIGWNRPEINITATLEAPAAAVVPQSLSGKIVINLVRDNAGRGETAMSISPSAYRTIRL
jgi:hypothetical protein